jgi:hypothetical protein
MNNSYDMETTLAITKEGTEYINKHYNCLDYNITNVEDDPDYRKIDIDEIFSKDSNRFTVEIKVDTYDKTGNYFFELVSNTNTWSDGCFKYTEADYIYYYFINSNELHILPTKKVREWFNKNMTRYSEGRCATKNSSGVLLYESLGRKVKIKDVVDEIGVDIINLNYRRAV